MPPLTLQLPEWFVSGGITMWVLALLSVVALATLISKILHFARIRPGNTRQADQLPTIDLRRATPHARLTAREFIKQLEQTIRNA